MRRAHLRLTSVTSAQLRPSRSTHRTTRMGSSRRLFDVGPTPRCVQSSRRPLDDGCALIAVVRRRLAGQIDVNSLLRTGKPEPFDAVQKLTRRRAITRLRYPIEQDLRRPQVGGVKAFGEPGINRRKKITSFIATPLISPKIGERHCGSQQPEPCLLLLGERNGRFEALFRFVLASLWKGEQHLRLETKQFGFVPPFACRRGRFERGGEKRESAVDVARRLLGQADNSNSDRQVEATRGKRLQGLQSGFSLLDTRFDFASQPADPPLHDLGGDKVVRQRVFLGKRHANVQMRLGLVPYGLG